MLRNNYKRVYHGYTRKCSYCIPLGDLKVLARKVGLELQIVCLDFRQGMRPHNCTPPKPVHLLPVHVCLFPFQKNKNILFSCPISISIFIFIFNKIF
jgi:hypothetical protein